jgi:heptosyltransferase-2
MALGALRGLRGGLAGARVAILGRPWIGGILEEARVADDIILTDRTSWRDALALGRRLRAERFDAAVLLQNAFEAAVVARLARIPRVIGYPTDGRRLLLSHSVSRGTDRQEHESVYYMRIAERAVQVLGGTPSAAPPDLSLAVRASTQERGARLLAAAGVASGSPVVVVNPGATNSRAKQWLPERFAAVADRIAAASNCSIVLVGSPGEREVAEQVRAAAAPATPIVDLTGRTSIAELIGVLACSMGLVSNDTGPAHLSAAMGLPTVTIFGPTEEFATHPIGPAAVSVREPVDCSPCMLRDCPIDHRCMTRVTVDAVVDAFSGVQRQQSLQRRCS